MILSLTDINARLASIRTGITCIQTDMDKIYSYFKTLANCTISFLILPSSTIRKVLQNIKREMALHPHLHLPNDHNEDIWSYYELPQVSFIVYDDHFLVILQVSVLDKSLAMNEY